MDVALENLMNECRRCKARETALISQAKGQSLSSNVSGSDALILFAFRAKSSRMVWLFLVKKREGLSHGTIYTAG